MATYTLNLYGFHPVDSYSGVNLVGVPFPDIMALVEVGDHYIKSGEAVSGDIVSNQTGEVLVKWSDGGKWVAE